MSATGREQRALSHNANKPALLDLAAPNAIRLLDQVTKRFGEVSARGPVTEVRAPLHRYKAVLGRGDHSVYRPACVQTAYDLPIISRTR